MGKACTFFGHRDCPANIRPKLQAVVVELIEQHGVDRFYVGRQGAFDAMARSVLRELEEVYPHISYAVVLERLPERRDESDPQDFSDTIFPEGLEFAPPRFAITSKASSNSSPFTSITTSLLLNGNIAPISPSETSPFGID